MAFSKFSGITGPSTSPFPPRITLRNKEVQGELKMHTGQGDQCHSAKQASICAVTCSTCKNPSTIDELGELCMTKEGGAARQTEPNTKGIHDNPVSSNHQAPSYRKNSGNLDTYHVQYTMPRGMSRLGVKSARAAQKRATKGRNDLTLRLSCKHAKPVNTAPSHRHTSTLGQHCWQALFRV